MTMHKEGRSYSDETILQVVELNKDEIGNLHSITLSDSEYVSHNIKTLPSSPFCYNYTFLWNTLPRKILQYKTLHKIYIFFKNSPLVGASITANIHNFNVYHTQFDPNR